MLSFSHFQIRLKDAVEPGQGAQHCWFIPWLLLCAIRSVLQWHRPWWVVPMPLSLFCSPPFSCCFPKNSVREERGNGLRIDMLFQPVVVVFSFKAASIEHWLMQTSDVHVGGRRKGKKCRKNASEATEMCVCEGLVAAFLCKECWAENHRIIESYNNLGWNGLSTLT